MEETERKKARIRTLKDKLDAPRLVAGGDVVPFAWRKPLVNPGKRMSKYYKVMTTAEQGRQSSLPVIRGE